MDIDVSAIVITLVFCSPLIVLAVILRLKLSRKFQHSKEEIRIEKQPERKLEEQQLTPPELPSAQRSIIKFIAVTIMAVLGGSLIGIVVSVFSNLIYIVFLFPLGMGFAGGKMLTDAIRMAKIRKTSQLIFMSLLIAITIYGTYHYGKYVGLQVQMSFRMFPGFSTAMEDKNLKFAKAVVDYALKKETGYSGFIGYMLLKANEGISIGRFYSSRHVNLGPILTWSYWILEFGIVLWVIISMGKKPISMPFCEFCGNWYGKEKHLGGTAPANEVFLLDLLKQKDFVELGKLIEKNAELPSLEIYFHGCEVCNKGQSRLIVRHAFQSSKGMLQFTDASQTILQPGDSVRLLNQLRSIGS